MPLRDFESSASYLLRATTIARRTIRLWICSSVQKTMTKKQNLVLCCWFISLHKLDPWHIHIKVVNLNSLAKRLHSLCYLHSSPDGLYGTKWRILTLADTQEPLLLQKSICIYLFTEFIHHLQKLKKCNDKSNCFTWKVWTNLTNDA